MISLASLSSEVHYFLLNLGPLTKTNTRGQEILVGVVSGGFGCGDKDRPGVYTRVRAALDFVNDYMRYSHLHHIFDEYEARMINDRKPEDMTKNMKKVV